MWVGRLFSMSLAVLAAAGCARQPTYPPYAQQAGYNPNIYAAAPAQQVAAYPAPVSQRVPVPAPRPPATYQVAQYAPAVFAEQPYTLGSGDRLRIVVFGQEGLTNTYAVDANGNITMPLIGGVPAQGLTTQQLGASVSARLRQGYIREPHVAVEIETYRPFFILGEVTFPGQYPYVANMTVETAIAIAGGFSPRAKRSAVDLTRPYGPQSARSTVPLYTPVRPGDTIVVAERWF